MTLIAVAAAGAIGASIAYVAEDQTLFPAQQIPRRVLAVALRAFGLGFLGALLLTEVVFPDVAGGEILADLVSGYICGAVIIVLLHRSDADRSHHEPGMQQPVLQALAGCLAMLTGAAAALAF